MSIVTNLILLLLRCLTLPLRTKTSPDRATPLLSVSTNRHSLSDSQVKAIFEGLLTGDLKNDMLEVVTDWSEKNGVDTKEVFD